MLPTTIEVSTKDKVTGTELKGSFVYSLPQTSAECVTAFGEDAVVEFVNSSLTILLQNLARKALPTGNVQSAVDKWVYGQKATRTRVVKDPVNTLLSRWDSYTPEYQQEILAAFAKKAGTGVVPNAIMPDGTSANDPVELSTNDPVELSTEAEQAPVPTPRPRARN